MKRRRWPSYAKARRATLAAAAAPRHGRRGRLIFWNTDGTDVDLHVVEPSGEECFYQHTANGQRRAYQPRRDDRLRPGALPAALGPGGQYRVSAHYFAADANRASTRTKVLALVYEGWGTPDEKVTIKAVALTGRSENHELVTVKR